MNNSTLKQKILLDFFENKINKYSCNTESCKNLFNIETGKKDANFGSSDGKYNFYTCAIEPIKSDSYSYDGDYLILPGNGANVGVCLFYSGQFEAYQRTYLLSTLTDKIEIKYALYYFMAYWSDYNKNKMFGAAIPYIRLGNLQDFNVKYPISTKEQISIVNKIEGLFELIDKKEKNDQEKQILKGILKEKILDSAIHGCLVLNDLMLSPIEKLSLTSEIPFDIPVNWKWCFLGDITDYGKNKKKNGKDILDNEWILELEDMEKDTGRILKTVYQRERKAVSDKNIFNANDVLYGKLRPYLNKCVIPLEGGYCSTEIEPMTPISEVDSKYLQVVLMSKYFLDYVNSCSYGAKMPRLGTKDGQKALIPVPPFEEQKRIVEKIEQCFELIEQL